MDDQIQTYEILLEGPQNRSDASKFLHDIYKALRSPKLPHHSVRVITPNIPDFALVYNGADNQNLYVMQFDYSNPVTPALCRNVRDILHARFGMDKEKFNALNPLALSSEPSIAKRGVRTR